MDANSGFTSPQVRVEREDRARELLKEVREIFEQYRREVSRKRAPWPESIRSRVLELWRLGVRSHQISDETALPAQTLYSWRKRLLREQRARQAKETGFSQLPVVQKKRRRTGFEIEMDEERRSQALQRSQLETRRASGPLVTVIVPNGLRLEGVPIEHAVRIARELGLT